MRLFIVSIAVLAAFSVHPAFAGDEVSAQDAVRIETDQVGKAFIFLIDEEPVATLDKAGLHVHGNVVYEGMVIDGEAASKATDAVTDPPISKGD